ncbi:MAG: MBL fold metallo-hydrolase [Candidatus Omnitrophota bacterium]
MLLVETFVLGPIETNCYLAYDGETGEGILIDPAVYDKGVADFISSKGITVKYTVNTHGHYDHIGGDNDFGYPVIIHEADAGFLGDPVKNLAIMMGYSMPGIDPARVVRDGDSVYVKGLAFKVIDTPGHTPGSMALECEGSLFTGDTLFCEGIGRTDIPFADTRDIEKSVEKLMRYSDNTVIYPGHGPASTIGHERDHNPFL